MPVDFRIVLPVLFIIDAANAVNAIRLNNRKYYAITKPLAVPLAVASYFVYLPENALIQPYQKYVIIAGFLHTQGDILLLFPKNKTLIFLYLGALSFFVGNIFNILWFTQPWLNHSSVVAIISAVLVLIAEIFFMKRMLEGSKPTGIALCVYSLAMATLIVLVASTKSIPATIGTLLFWISDYTIGLREQKLRTQSDEFTFITYIVGQALILTGMLFLQI